MEDGPPRFPPGFTCPVVLRNPLEPAPASHTGLSPSMDALSIAFCCLCWSHIEVLQPRRDESPRFGLFRVRSPLLAESLLISFPLVTEMFHFTRLASACLCIQHGMNGRAVQVFPFGHLRVKGCLAPHRSLSQLATSFIASARLGIHRQPESLVGIVYG